MICAFDKEKAECVAVEKGIYKTPGGKRLDMLICYPQTTPKGCILLIHGGGWKSDTCERLRLHAQYAAMCGAVGASVSYRLLDEKNGVDVRDGLEDCVNALSYIRKICEKKYGKISVIAAGDSAGGYYAACLGCGALMKKYGVKPVDFVVDWNGIVDLTGKWSYGICLKNTDTKNKKEIEREFRTGVGIMQNERLPFAPRVGEGVVFLFAGYDVAPRVFEAVDVRAVCILYDKKALRSVAGARKGTGQAGGNVIFAPDLRDAKRFSEHVVIIRVGQALAVI